MSKTTTWDIPFEQLTRREKRILRDLAQYPPGKWVPRKELKAGATILQHLYFYGFVDGAGGRDERGYGNTPESSFWTLTAKGRRATARPPEAA